MGRFRRRKVHSKASYVSSRDSRIHLFPRKQPVNDYCLLVLKRNTENKVSVSVFFVVEVCEKVLISCIFLREQINVIQHEREYLFLTRKQNLTNKKQTVYFKVLLESVLNEASRYSNCYSIWAKFKAKSHHI